MLEWAEVWGDIIRDRPIQCNGIRYDREGKLNAGIGVEEEERGEEGKHLDSNFLSSGIPHILPVLSWLHYTFN